MNEPLYPWHASAPVDDLNISLIESQAHEAWAASDQVKAEFAARGVVINDDAAFDIMQDRVDQQFDRMPRRCL